MKRSLLQLSAQTLRGLYFLNKYRFLTISQFAAVTGYSYQYAKELLRGLQKHKAVDFFGYQPVSGHGKTPKVYYPTERAWTYVMLESAQYDAETIGRFVPIPEEITWTPEMYHRLRIIDLFVALELAVEKHEQLSIEKTFLSYRRVPKTLIRETTDYVSEPQTSDMRIVPDGAFILKNHETDNAGLFFLEVDMGTERLTAPKSRDQRSTIKGKLELYDRYLSTGRFAATYQDYGKFRSFLLLFVTQSPERTENIRQVCQTFPSQFHAYYRFATIADATTDFLGRIWSSRSATDTVRYALVRRG